MKGVINKGIQELVEKDGDVKIVMIELPVLGPNSQYAAKAAPAANMQGKYAEFHAGMMKASGRLSPEGVLKVAEGVGLDLEKLKKDMEAPEVAMELAKNRLMSQKLGISGTPAFVIGDQLVPGAIDSTRMEAMIKQARGG